MNKAESKYFNTAVRMNEAFLSLLEKKDYQFITVKEICNEAQVNRSTFYLHYDTIDDLLSETLEYVTESLEQKFIGIDTINSNSIETASNEDLLLITPKYLLPYLSFVKENRKIFTVAVTQPAVIRVNDTFNKRYSEIFAPIMRRFHVDEKESQYRLGFYLNGMFSVITEWIKGGCKDDIDYIAHIIITCVFPNKDNRYDF